MTRPLVFISYSQKDEAEKDKLMAHLGVLKRELIEPWSDDRLGAGAKWEEEINHAIARARVAVLLITANFLNSDFILETEVPKILERQRNEGLVVMPVIARPCAWKTVTWLKDLAVRPKTGNPIWGEQGGHVEEDLAGLAEELAGLIRKIQETLELEREPPERAVPDPLAVGKGKVTKSRSVSKLLIVDDDSDFCESLIDIFEDTEISLLSAGSVAEARVILDADREIQILLLDLLLPGENGTKLLEHLVGRASDYRVIVLTAHDHLLPARDAVLYNVFQYLSKSEKGLTGQSLRFAVEQARRDIEREHLARENKAADFDDIILNKYPTPFTYIYQELKSDLLPLETLTRQKDIFDLVLRFSALVLMCEYFNSRSRSDELDARIRKKALTLTSANSLGIIDEIVNRQGVLPTTSFLNQFSAFFNAANRTNFQDLMGIFDKYLSESPKRSEFEYEEVVQLSDKLVLPLLQDYRFITHFLVCYVSSVQKVGTGYKYRLKECTGANPQLLFSRREFTFLMDASELYLVSLNSGQFQSLHPFVILEHCTYCKQLEIFFYARFRDSQLHYLSYKTGHSLATKTNVEDFVDVIRLGL